MISAQIMELSNWLSTPWDLAKLRIILGELLNQVNEVSLVFKRATRNPSHENAQAANDLLSAIQSGQYQHLQTLLPEIDSKLSDFEERDPNAVKVIKNLVHTLQRSTFNNSQIEQLQQLSTYDPQQKPEFPEETNKEGLDQHLKSSIYNTSDDADKTLKVIREVLQNAVDATDPKRHPELLHRAEFTPMIKITTSEHDGLIDLIIEDFGTGMNWDVLSKKFFVTFESGKKDDPHSTGGFGIAKTLIQESPKHGWSIDTNKIHSNRFQKNVYFGTKMGQGYAHPASQIKKEATGTTISLFGLPYVPNYRIREYCEKYATNGRVKIVLNGREIKPTFELNTDAVKPLSNINSLIDLYGDSQSTQDVAKTVLGSLKSDIEDKMAELNDFQTPQTSIQFHVRRVEEYSGNLFVMVNGQFQFEESKYFNKLQLICDIQTTAKAGSDEYPLDPGRSKIKGKLGEAVEKICSQIKSFSDKVGSDTLFKQGIESLTVNADQDPMRSHGRSEVSDQAVDAIYNDLSRGFEEEIPEPPSKSDIIDAIEKQTGKVFNDSERKLASAVMNDVLAGKEEKITQSDIRKIIEGLSTPANILIQKNFVARDWINQNMDLTAEILILWQKTLKILVDKLTATKFGRAISQKEFVPGLIYSNEANGLYVPAAKEKGRPYPSVSINPITAASAINPALFAEKLMSKAREEAFKTLEQDDELEDQTKKNAVADTPTNRLSKLLYHIAVHELTHLMFPESWDGNYDNFHNNVTYLEYIAHDCYYQIRDEVKKSMGDLRKNSNKLINAIAKQSKKTNENVAIKTGKNISFSDWFYGSNWKVI